ncbi:MAG: flavin reductase family protein [Chitinophagaceae bacterium]|nr:MAG: flavin reductase family protein [Chitinophagaceae bacterium]
MILNLAELKASETQYFLQHVVAPRPICFASTVDADGTPNLSPFSFFNLFSAQPPIVVFSPARRVRDNTVKHTLENVLAVPEVVINMVSYDIVQQASLTSCDYPRGTDEFLKAGFTKEAATLVRPPMVKESPAKMECRVLEVKSLGDSGGAGQLVICEVLVLHIDDRLLDADRKINQADLDLVARLGGDWYCRASADSLFKVPKPNTKLGIGIDTLPAAIRGSRYLSGNHLGALANVHEPPVVQPSFADDHLKQIMQYYSLNPADLEKETHLYAARLLDEGRVDDAWQVLLTVSGDEQ